MNRFQHDNVDLTITAKRRALGLYNGKPYRTKAQKALAKKHAVKRSDGAYRVSQQAAPLSMHPAPRATS